MNNNQNKFDENVKFMLRKGHAKEHQRNKKLKKVVSDKKVLENFIHQMASRFTTFKKEHTTVIKEEN